MWVEPIEFKYWDMLSKDIKYLAKDESGYWFGFSERPSARWAGWATKEDHYEIPLKQSLFPKCHWKNSLMERPEK